MAAKVEILGTHRLIEKLNRLSPETAANLNKSMTGIIIGMDRDVKEVISKGGRSGKVYKRGKSVHQASAMGEPPKTDRGGLIAGFNFDIKKTANKVTGILRNISSYAAAVEFKPMAMGGRPFMRPLYQRWESRIKSMLIETVKVSVKSVKK